MSAQSPIRPVPISRKCIRLLPAASILAVATGPALAQDTGEAALEAYLAGLKQYGVEVSYGPVSYDGPSDTVTVADLVVTMEGSIDNLPAGKNDIGGADGTDTPVRTTTLTYAFSMDSGTVSMTGLTRDGESFRLAEAVYSDDTRFTIEAAAEGQGQIGFDGRMTGIRIRDYEFVLPAFPAEDPQRQASRWLPFMRASLKSSMEAFDVDAIGVTVEAYDETTDGGETKVLSGTVQVDGFRMAGVSGGRVEDYSIDSISQTLSRLDKASGRMLTQETRQGKTLYSGLDYAPVVDLLDPDVPVSDEVKTILGSVSAIDYSARQEITDGHIVETTVDRISMDDFTITKRDSGLLALFDTMLARKTPSPEELITGAFQFYRSFGVGDARVSGIAVKVPTPDSQSDIAVEIEEMAMTNLSSDGIGEMMMVGVSAPDLPNGGAFQLDWGAITDIEFAEYTPMRAMISTLMADPDFGEEHPLDVARAFLPRSFGYELKGLDMTLPDVGRTQVGSAEMRVSTTVPPVPTSFHLKNSGIRVPVHAIEEAEARALFRALGLDEVVWSDETRLTWDEATLDLRLERMMVDIEGLGHAELSARFANVPKALFEDPERQGQMAMIVAQFVDASLLFKDAGLASKGVAHIAENEGIPENVFREALVAQAVQATAPIGSEAFTNMVGEAASTFLRDPDELRITMTPPAPVPLAQILGSLAAPQTLPDLLNVSITAN